VDYSLYTANIKRKRPTQTPRKVRKSGPPIVGGDNDEDDDEDWAGGSRNISFSGGRRSSLRNSRQ
jgi:cohesin loading factor subunit SCC2